MSSTFTPTLQPDYPKLDPTNLISVSGGTFTGTTQGYLLVTVKPTVRTRVAIFRNDETEYGFWALANRAVSQTLAIDIGETVKVILSPTGGTLGVFYVPEAKSIEVGGGSSGGGGGTPGSGTLKYTHNQSTPSANWNVQHNLGARPTLVVVRNNLGTDIECVKDWNASTDNLLVLRFNEPVSGTATIFA